MMKEEESAAKKKAIAAGLDDGQKISEEDLEAEEEVCFLLGVSL